MCEGGLLLHPQYDAVQIGLITQFPVMGTPFSIVLASQPCTSDELMTLLIHPQRLAVPHASVAIGNFSGLLKGNSMVVHWANENKIYNIMVVREIIIFCSINHHSGSPITICKLYLENQINHTW